MEPDPALQHPPQGESRLVGPNDQQVLTVRRETDCRSALTRGLREYLEQLSIDWVGGRRSRFVKVFDTWAAPEVVAEFPSAAVYALVDGEYEGSNLAQHTDWLHNPDYRAGGPRFSARKAGEYTIPLKVEVWCNTHQDRMALSALLESAMNPVDWIAGVRLLLPHYHGCHGRYLLTSNTYRDGISDNNRRVLLVTCEIEASIDHIAFVGCAPPFRPSAELAVSDDGSDPHPVTIGSR